MANICDGTLAIECSDKEKLEKIQNAFQNEYDVPTLSFDGLLDVLNVKTDDCDTRGEFDSPELKEMDGFYALIMNFNCKWRFDENILDAISNVHGDLTFEYIEEECGNGIFTNTDVNGKYFVDRYYLYIEDDDSYYFASGEEDKVIEAIKVFYPNAVLKSLDDCLLLNYAKKLTMGYNKISSATQKEVLEICQKLFPNSNIKEYEDCPIVKDERFISFDVFKVE